MIHDGRNLLREFIQSVAEAIRTTKKSKHKWRDSGKFDINYFKDLQDITLMELYASDYLEILGEGSSRSVYALTSKKVLKIAKNVKGIAQNNAELQVYTDPATEDVSAKIYDSHDRGRWLVSELVRPIHDEREFERLTGVDWEEFIDDLKMTISSTARSSMSPLRKDASEFTKKVYKMSEMGSARLKVGDLTELDHWGKTSDGRVVILDYGFTTDVSEKYYGSFNSGATRRGEDKTK